MRSLIVHAILLAFVLSLGLALSAPGVPFTSDEGAVMIQARLIERTGKWVEPNPLPAIDPTSQARTVPNGDTGTKGRAPYAKHPLYPALVALADSLGGTGAVAALGVIGTVVAALAAAGIAGFLDRRLRLWSLWITGLGGPLAFDAWIVVAHSIGAAAAGVCGYAALRAMSARGRDWLAWTAVVGVGVAVTTAFRTEGALLGVAFAAGAVLVGLSRNGVRRIAALGVGAAGIVGVAATRLIERAMVHSLIGGLATNNSPTIAALPYSFLHARVHAFVRSWLTSTDFRGRGVQVVLLGALVAVAVAGLIARRGRRYDLVAFLLTIACGLLLARFLAGPEEAIPGLLVAFPLGCFALVAVKRADLASPSTRFLAIVAGAFVVGVVMTQYPDGGGLQWGGRYFAIGLPLAAPLVAAVVARRAAGHVPIVAGLATASLLVAGIGWWTLTRTHQATHHLADQLRGEARKVDSGGLPIVLTTFRLLPQIDWSDYSHYRWLVPSSAETLRMLESRLAGTGVRSVLVATGAPDTDLAQTAPYRIVERQTTPVLTTAVLSLG